MIIKFKPCKYLYFFLILLIILPGCRKVAVKNSSEQEIKQLISKWHKAFEKNDYTIQWKLLSSKSPLKNKFTPFFSFDKSLKINKNEAAFLAASKEAFGHFKSYEIYRITINDKKAKVYLIFHWGGSANLGEALIRPMRKKTTLELIKAKNKLFVFDEKEGFEKFSPEINIKKLTDLTPSKENVVEIYPNQNKSVVLFRTSANKLGLIDTLSRKPIFISLDLKKETNILQVEWSSSGNTFGIRYDASASPESFEPAIFFFKKNGDQISKVYSAGFFKFVSDENIVWISGESGLIEMVEYNFIKNVHRIIWDEEKSKAEKVYPLEIVGSFKEKVVISGRSYENYEWEYSPGIFGIIDAKSGEFKILTDKWYLLPGVYALKENQLAFFGGKATVEKETNREMWKKISLVTIDILSGEEKTVMFMGNIPVENMEIVNHLSWSPQSNEVVFSYGTKGLFLASLERKEFEGIYPENLDWENSRIITKPPVAVEVLSAYWPPKGDKILFVTSSGKVFISSSDRGWMLKEINFLSKRVDGIQCNWQSDKNIIFTGWKKAEEKNKPRVYAEPKSVYMLDVSLK
ncbi:MAG: hypothetical protein HY776_06800 [Actinobacteria bacterium]|nr:hypothetical protein [Actinomycetota bacterium]